jgi:hypothetical protein
MVTLTQNPQPLPAWTGIPSGGRTIRGAARVQVDLPGVLSSPALDRACSVRVLDLSSSGARLRSPHLGIGEACELSFLPPGRTESVWLTCQVVRHVAVADGAPTEIAVVFSGPPLLFRLDLVHP